MDRAGLLASRVRMVEPSDTALTFPGISQWPEGNVLAYSCAAARDSHPLPCLRRAAKTRVPNEPAKNKDNRGKNLTGEKKEVNRRKLSTPSSDYVEDGGE
jgi:hypothetical protein